VAVEKAAMDKNHRFAAGEYKVGAARKLGPMETVAVTERMNDPADL
jgi:hypothetical protein